MCVLLPPDLLYLKRLGFRAMCSCFDLHASFFVERFSLDLRIRTGFRLKYERVKFNISIGGVRKNVVSGKRSQV